MNDDIAVQHIIAGKIAEAVWGSSSFKKPIKPIKLLEENDTIASRNAKVSEFLKRKGLITD